MATRKIWRCDLCGHTTGKNPKGRPCPKCQRGRDKKGKPLPIGELVLQQARRRRRQRRDRRPAA